MIECSTQTQDIPDINIKTLANTKDIENTKLLQIPKVYLSYLTKGGLSGEVLSNVVSVIVEGVKDSLTQAEFEISYDPKSVKIEDVVSPRLPDPNLSVLVGADLDNTQGKLSIKALVVNKEQLIGSHTNIPTETNVSKELMKSHMSDIDEEKNVAPIAHIILKDSVKIKDISLKLTNIKLHDAQGQEIYATFPSESHEFLVYPNPYIATKDDNIHFINLPRGAIIRIYDLSAALVKELKVGDEGRVSWDVQAEDIASGIYIYIVKDEKSYKTSKLAIIR